jgi:hypothetical protein
MLFWWTTGRAPAPLHRSHEPARRLSEVETAKGIAPTDSSFETRLRRSSERGGGTSARRRPRPEAPRSGLEGRIQIASSLLQRPFSAALGERDEHREITTDIGFLLRSRPPFDATLGRHRVGDSRIVFGVRQRHGASAKRVATLVEPLDMFADPRVDRPSSDARIVATVRAAQYVDRSPVQEFGPPNLSPTQ